MSSVGCGLTPIYWSTGCAISECIFFGLKIKLWVYFEACDNL